MPKNIVTDDLKPVQINLPLDLLASLDSLAATTAMRSRSAVIRFALQQFVDRQAQSAPRKLITDAA